MDGNGRWAKARGLPRSAGHRAGDGMDQLKKLEKDSVISQDESRVLSEKVQKLTDDTIAEMDKIVAVKEGEIMQV
ncbi:ribosome recycling factor [Brucella ceti]|uniref:ribosome recycling factor n=1 Tax=Brucella ceti TaxID=120577 RepID=UPI0034A0CF13